ncbi:MAG: tRNA (guanosine(37)-N1)-methyltransferase TrmD [Xanthomonadales bacterium]|uniref:tRNA (guanosine(37)-N1)-methyltransferase TrmD n=1 Tax=Hydrogenophaga sp. TaxID=1904254 RepID=UPI0016B99DC8|nr:tRNA (guanosine(37)-N1)-methyltransferase TrmD [Hydrogenophaga sp.]NIM71515.1 tRNA (guanosine(37)-N1)-methyltransferase TrmD [Xanthomonadales bacterium]NIN32684.1 tRNA (guanosine(37)-N1)-methyltransferase TrmD [Hydrogenophaga sp.]NIN60668.1 tRNA (guanosine(37)-N1)-methyltransferase TrmD [Xanthomonadales bacterium]NIN76016.1 tRNA (guanosine(37)-N1)-methyltransferase TrmD [Xanthomonadales bacterium]NIO15289.1 tRNA (guanosine(37)-N1)-methyltransferase TrmD [Xanthomonadales bacterium]
MHIDVITLFPEAVEALVGFGVTGRAVERGLVELRTWNPRDFADDRHRTVDDRPYGGGPGMVMTVEPLRSTLRAARASGGGGGLVSLLSPQGEPLTQAAVAALAARDRLILLCGRYEGIDERLVAAEVDEEWSLGDYVISGGELAAAVVIDAVARLLPGALGDELSAVQDSFAEGLLDCPHYSRPECVDGVRVPEVLLSGDHAAIGRWRRKQALGRTWQRRPDLLEGRELNEEDRGLLEEFRQELKE